MCAKKFDTLFDPFFSYLAHFSSRFAMLAVATHQYLCNVHRPVESSTTKFQTHTRPIIWLNHRQHVRTHTLSIIHTHTQTQADWHASRKTLDFFSPLCGHFFSPHSLDLAQFCLCGIVCRIKTTQVTEPKKKTTKTGSVETNCCISKWLQTTYMSTHLKRVCMSRHERKKEKNIEPKQLARLSLLVVVPLMRFYIHSFSSSLRINHIEDECNRVDQTKLARELI